MQDKSKVLLGLFHFFISIEKRTNYIPYISQIIMVIHSLTLISMLILLSLIPQNTIVFSTYSTTPLQLLLSVSDPTLHFQYYGAGLFALIFILTLSHNLVFSSNDQIYFQSKPMHLLSLLAAHLLLLYEIFLPIIINYLINHCRPITAAQFMILLPTILITLIQLFLRHRVFTFMIAIVVGLINIFPTSVGAIGVAIISLWYFNQNPLYLVFITTALFSALQQQLALPYDTLLNQMYIQPLAYLVLGLIFITLRVIFTQTNYEDKEPLEQNQILLQYYLKRKNIENTEGEAKFGFHFEEEYYYDKYTEKDVISRAESEVVKSTILKKIKEDVHKSLEMKLFFIQTMVELKYKVREAFKMLSQLESNYHNLWDVYRIFKTYLKVSEKYTDNSTIKENWFKLKNIIKVCQAHDSFYYSVNSLLNKIGEFWVNLVKNSFILSIQIQDQLKNIFVDLNNFQVSMSLLSSYNIQRQAKLLCLLKQLINPFKKQSKYVSRFKQSHQLSFQYFILSKTTIIQMSLKLLRVLNFPSTLILNSQISQILPQNFSSYLFELEQKYISGTLVQPQRIPLFDLNGNLHICKCTLYFIPSGCSFMYEITRAEDEHKLIFYYCVNSETIRGMSASLKQFLQVQTCPVHILDLFNCEITATEIQMMRNSEVFNAKIVLKTCKVKGEVQLSIDGEINTAQKHIIFIKVHSETYKMMLINNKTKEQPIIQEKKEDIYKNQNFFCPIDNPYKSKITQKLSAQREINIKNYWLWLAFFLILLWFSLLANLLFFHFEVNSKNEQALSTIAVMSEYNKQYINLLSLFSQYYTQQFIKAKQNEVSLYLKQNNFPQSTFNATLQYYSRTKQSTTNEFKTSYFTYRDLTDHTQMNYTQVYSNFQINMSTSQLGFYDVIVYLQMKEQSMEFLLANYPSIVSVMPVYQQYQQFYADYANNYLETNITQLSVFLISITLLLLTYAVAYEIGEVANAIRVMYSLIDIDDIKNAVAKVETINAMVAPILDQQPPVFKIDTNNTSEEQNTNGVVVKVEKCCQSIYVGLVMAIFLGMSAYFQYSDLQVSKQQLQPLMQLYQKYQTEQMRMQNQFASAIQEYFLITISNTSSAYTKQNDLRRIDFSSDSLPAVFVDGFIPDSSLCNEAFFSLVKDPLLSNINCSEVGNGILTRGYGETLEYYQSLVFSIGSNIVNVSIFDCQRHKCFFEVLYIKNILVGYLRSKILQFVPFFVDYHTTTNSSSKQLQIWIGVGLLGIALLMAVNLKQIKSKLQIYFGLICIIPQSALFKFKMTHYIRKNNILDRIEKI